MSSGSSKKVIFAALIGNFLVALTKFVAAIFTGSSAMISEGIHSVVDTGNQVLLLYGLHRAKRPADECFPFGYGKEVYFWSFIVAIMIFAVGAGVSIYEGILHLADPSELTNPWVNYVVLVLAIIFEGGSWLYAYKEFNKTKGRKSLLQAVAVGKDPSMFVVFFEDTAAMLGLVTALVGVMLTHITGHHYYDGIASIIIGLILAGTAAWLASETKGLLIGESADLTVVQGIREMIHGHDYIDHVNEVLTLHMGPEFILVNVSVDFKDKLTAGAVESSIQDLTNRIKDKYPRVKKVFVEAEARKDITISEACSTQS